MGKIHIISFILVAGLTFVSGLVIASYIIEDEGTVSVFVFYASGVMVLMLMAMLFVVTNSKNFDNGGRGLKKDARV